LREVLSVLHVDYQPISDEELVFAADEIFLAYDCREESE